MDERPGHLVRLARRRSPELTMLLTTPEVAAILIELKPDYIDQAMLRNAQAPLGLGA